MAIRPDDPLSSSEQIRTDLRLAIAKGEIAPGEQLPSNAELKAKYGVATQTVQNAMNALKAEGLVTTAPGRGVFLRSDLDTDELVAMMAKNDSEAPAYDQVLEELHRLWASMDVVNSRLDELERHQREGSPPPPSD